jgi:hypothetical protein
VVRLVALRDNLSTVRSVVRCLVASSLLLLGGCGSAAGPPDGSASGGTSGTGGGGGGKSGSGGGAPGQGGVGGGGTAGAAGARGGAAGTASGGATAGAGGAAGTGAGGGDGGVPPCDTTGDGLDDVASCVTSPVYLRFVNATSTETFDVYVSGATNPVRAGLGAHQVSVVGPVQAKVLDYEFRASGVSPIRGEVTLAANGHSTLVVYLDPTTTLPVLKTNAATQMAPGMCGAGAQVDFGDFTTLTPTPVVVLYMTNGGTSWTPALSPGLTVGQILGSGCWNSGTSIQFGAGPTRAATPADTYQALTFGYGQTYQLLMTDDGIIAIDNLDHVTNVLKL